MRFLFSKQDWPTWDEKQPEKNRLCIGINKTQGSMFYFVVMDGWDGYCTKILGNGTLTAALRKPLCWRYASELGVSLGADLPKRGAA